MSNAMFLAVGLAVAHSALEVEVRSPQPLSSNRTIINLHAEAMAQRARSGLQPQALDEELCKLCQRWANHMARTGNFAHGGGENIIAMGQTTPQGAIRSWLGSGGHRAFVLGRHSRCGWGAQRGPNGTWYWVGVFR